MKDLDDTEKKVLKALFPDKRLWYRTFLYWGIADKPLRRSLEHLQEMGYIVRDEPPQLKRGMKITYHLQPEGRRVATELIVGDAGRDFFIRVLRKLVLIAELYDDEGEKAAELAIDIVNMLVDEEKSLRFRDAVLELIQRLSG